MTPMNKSVIDDEIDKATTAFVMHIAGLAAGSYIREGIVKEAVTGVIWEIYHGMPDQRYALVEALEQMDTVVREQIHSDTEDNREADAARESGDRPTT